MDYLLLITVEKRLEHERGLTKHRTHYRVQKPTALAGFRRRRRDATASWCRRKLGCRAAADQARAANVYELRRLRRRRRRTAGCARTAGQHVPTVIAGHWPRPWLLPPPPQPSSSSSRAHLCIIIIRGRLRWCGVVYAACDTLKRTIVSDDVYNGISGGVGLEKKKNNDFN